MCTTNSTTYNIYAAVTVAANSEAAAATAPTRQTALQTLFIRKARGAANLGAALWQLCLVPTSVGAGLFKLGRDYMNEIHVLGIFGGLWQFELPHRRGWVTPRRPQN
ncbi:hypothetical protein B0H13DRAFT_1874038 [Mycena leptocephala]|nr:hypothetical protein B0H13DRAFT_1874038 [Mycena leptocephala]